MTAEGAGRETSRRLRLFTAALVALVCLASPARAETPTPAAVLDAFAKIAFGNEYTVEPDPRLQKWAKPIRWRAYEAVALDDGERAFLARHIARLAGLTGLEFTPAESWPEANFVLYFVAEAEYESAIRRHLDPGRRHLLPRFAETACLGLPRHHRLTHEIEYAIALIPVERARARGLMRSCIAEETTQMLGLRNDSDAVPGTLFNDKGTARDLTPLDEAMVRLLYHPRLRPGMRRDEALAAARAVLPGLLSGGR